MMICSVVGARPNFMKMAPIIHEMRKRGLEQILVHTGQHYDEKMSQVFFDELDMPAPDIYLGIGSDTHARQTARIMTEFEDVCLKKRPTLVIVGGDVNSTMAVALVASKLCITVAHIEAGLRSFDRAMPEEINRIVTDHLSDLLFTTEDAANANLINEGIPKENIHFVGNCMIDTLCSHVDKAVQQCPWTAFELKPNEYALLTLHRPSNVDDKEMLSGFSHIINEIAEYVPVLFPIHPRTKKQISTWDIPFAGNIRLCEPLPYLDFLGLMARARFVLTDSGGIQEETTALGIPCLTLRANTERPSTISHGTNRLVGSDKEQIMSATRKILANQWPTGNRPPLWDGCAAERVVDVIEAWERGKER